MRDDESKAPQEIARELLAVALAADEWVESSDDDDEP